MTKHPIFRREWGIPERCPFCDVTEGFSVRVSAFIGPFMSYKYGGHRYLFVSFILYSNETEIKRHDL